MAFAAWQGIVVVSAQAPRPRSPRHRRPHAHAFAPRSRSRHHAAVRPFANARCSARALSKATLAEHGVQLDKGFYRQPSQGLNPWRHKIPRQAPTPTMTLRGEISTWTNSPVAHCLLYGRFVIAT